LFDTVLAGAPEAEGETVVTTWDERQAAWGFQRFRVYSATRKLSVRLTGLLIGLKPKRKTLIPGGAGETGEPTLVRR